MGDLYSRSDAFNWSISRLADFLEMDRKTLTKRINAAQLEPAGMRNGYPVYKALEAIKCALYINGRPAGLVDLDSHPEARKAWYQSENERIKFERATGQLIPEADVAKNMALMAKTLAAGLDSLPDLLERDAALQPDAIDLVVSLVDSLRESMADQLVQGAACEGEEN